MSWGQDDWRQGASCRKADPNLFVPERREHACVTACREWCRTCPVFDHCLAYGLAHLEEQGIFAGLSQRDRGIAARGGFHDWRATSGAPKHSLGTLGAWERHALAAGIPSVQYAASLWSCEVDEWDDVIRDYRAWAESRGWNMRMAEAEERAIYISTKALKRNQAKDALADFLETVELRSLYQADSLVTQTPVHTPPPMRPSSASDWVETVWDSLDAEQWVSTDEGS